MQLESVLFNKITIFKTPLSKQIVKMQLNGVKFSLIYKLFVTTHFVYLKAEDEEGYLF